MAEVDAQDVEVEEGEGVAGFFDGPEGVFVGLGEVIEEAMGVVGAHLARVALAVEEDEVTGALGEALARLGAAEVGEGGLAELVEQAWGLGGGDGRAYLTSVGVEEVELAPQQHEGNTRERSLPRPT